MFNYLERWQFVATKETLDVIKILLSLSNLCNQQNCVEILIPCTEEPDGPQSLGSQRVGIDWATE